MEKNIKINKEFKNKKGITLVALIITIIIMLILAGVAISVVINGESLFSKTREASRNYEKAAKNENKTISNLMNYIDNYLNGSSDNTEEIPTPQNVSLVSSNIATKTFTLTATAKDTKSLLTKYEFYIDNKLVETLETSEETVSYNAKVEHKNTEYNCKVRVYNEVGGHADKNIIVKTQFLVEVGDFVNYDAGNWNAETDTEKIVASGGTVNWSTDLSTIQGQFCGFVDGQSRDKSSISSVYNGFLPFYEDGWRIWDIDDATGVITLVSAGNTECYYSKTNKADNSKDILANRDYTMYLNELGNSADILTGKNAASWYNKYVGKGNTNYEIYNNGANTSSTFHHIALPSREELEIITVLENGSYYWLVNTFSNEQMYVMNPNKRWVGSNADVAFGVRILITLKEGVSIKDSVGNGTQNSKLELINNS